MIAWLVILFTILGFSAGLPGSIFNPVILSKNN